MFYQVLPVRKIPGYVLTYSYDSVLPEGQLVTVPIRNKPTQAIIFKQIDVPNFDVEKIKPISEILPFCFSTKNISFLKLFTQNTFNSANLVLDAMIRPLDLLIKKDWQVISQFLPYSSDELPNGKIDFYLDINITLRIRYIIRTIISNFKTPKTTLIIFPEKKYLEKIYQEFQTKLKNNSEKNLAEKICSLIYTGEKNQKSKQTVKTILQIEKKTKHKIIFATRSGIFLPFRDLDTIILIDESNSLHIQDQNRLYFDAREAVFLLSKAFSSNLYFISTLPSIRLQNFYSSKVLEQFLTKDTTSKQKPPKIQIFNRDSKTSNLQLLSYQLEQLLDPGK